MQITPPMLVGANNCESTLFWSPTIKIIQRNVRSLALKIFYLKA